MSSKKPVRLLILEASQNRAEELIVLLRKAGRATRAHQIESAEDLQNQLKEQKWDLLLGVSEANDLTMEHAIGIIRESERDIPIILIAEGRDPESITAGLRLGALDVALDDDDERLTMIIERELSNLYHRRERRRAEKEVSEIDRRNQLLLASSTAAIGYVHEGMHIYTNSTYSKMFGYEDPDDFAGIPIIDLISSSDQGKFKAFLKSYDKNESESEEFICVTSEDKQITASLSLSPATYDGESCTQVIFKVSSDADTAYEERIKELSSQDLLTGLPNRASLIEQLDTAVDKSSNQGQASILMYISIDNFAKLRTEAGISNADLVLADLANLLAELTAEEHLIARFGDDVFALLYNSGDKEAAAQMAENLRGQVEERMSDVAGKSYQSTTSIGLALVSESSSSAEDVISRAYQACTSMESGNGVNFYQAAEVKMGEAGVSLTSENIKDMIKTAIENNAFKLMFQPIISLHGDDDEQFEVLLRLVDDDDNELLPGQFLGPAEDAGLLEKLDRWVILQSIKMLSEHRSTGSKAKLFINLTHKSMSDETFLPWMSVALKAAKLPSDAVILQIHESDATAYIKQAASFTKGMSALHCKTSINHFGCSLNPMNLLKHLTPDFVKLDDSFAQEIDQSEEKLAELKKMVTSLQETGVLTAISGIEDPMILSTLWQAGITFIQGYYLSPPLENMDYDFASEDT
ncbi:MAG: sensor domain-containing phosphodiesterase [Pseudomonadales bacterium]|jgi:diguanylate cyclase (GGDEF)-like protein|tara:strand:- start:26190 stop:28274 length:2085 start_codon:yes stop_codon:yes gene_type:complete